VPPSEILLTTAAAARRIGVTPGYLRSQSRQPGGPNKYVTDIGVFYKPSELDAWHSSQHPPECFVYFIESDNGMVKIGSSVDPETRLRALQTGSPCVLRLLFVEPGGSARERELHARFDACRRHGEWFEPDEALKEYMNAH